MTGYGFTPDRIKSAGAAAALVALIGYGLIVGLGVSASQRVVEQLTVLALLPDSPPPKPDSVRAPKQAERRKEGAASPPNIISRATELVAPPVPILIPPSPPIVVAPVAGLGSDRSAGAAPIVGPGTGSGGQGDGFGRGDDGDGDGDGDARGGGTPAELINNKLRYRELPRALWDARAAGIVHYGARIGADGRLLDCRVTRTSGNVALDAATCAQALRYVRFRPARDKNGRKVIDSATFIQEWRVERYAGGEDR